MKRVRLKSDKKSYMNVKRGDVENVAVNDKVNKKNDASPQNRERLISSTPLRKMHSINGEESPDLDCHSSPIFPCTQEGGNEVAWDWQSSLNRTPESRNKKRNVHLETPKGTKLLQKKRNSNSPLLYKPLKRKTIKMENIENIGQFAAELQALDERVRFMKQSDKNPGSLAGEKSSLISGETISKEEVARIQDKEQNYVGVIGSRDDDDNDDDDANANRNNASGSYDDLFDDSIDDYMARCTQEIEEKFNLIADKGNCPDSSRTAVKKEESSSSKLQSDKTSTGKSPRFTPNENIGELSARNFLHESTSDGNALKTYSKLSWKRDANSGIHAPTVSGREKDLHKGSRPNNNNNNNNNNNMIDSRIEKSRDDAKLPRCNIAELFGIPDDSFDDCLATCVEDEKLISASTGPNDSSNLGNNATRRGTNCKRLIHAPLKPEATSVDSLKSAASNETSSCAFLENRKFFKTKSLSDQHIGRDAIVNAKNVPSASCFTTRSKLSSESTTITRASATRGSVSSKPIVTNERKIENSAILLIGGTGRTHGSDVNRCAVKEGGDRFGRYNSTGNMRNDPKETTRSGGSQPMLCTAEEIEQKRLQAKMRLEARKKFYSLKINVNR